MHSTGSAALLPENPAKPEQLAIMVLMLQHRREEGRLREQNGGAQCSPGAPCNALECRLCDPQSPAAAAPAEQQAVEQQVAPADAGGGIADQRLPPASLARSRWGHRREIVAQPQQQPPAQQAESSSSLHHPGAAEWASLTLSLQHEQGALQVELPWFFKIPRQVGAEMLGNPAKPIGLRCEGW